MRTRAPDGARLRRLLRAPEYRRLAAVQWLNQAADGLYQIALASVLIFNLEAAHTPAQVTKVLAITAIPFSVIGPFTGPFIDRFSRKSILLGVSGLRTVLTLALIPFLDGPEGITLLLAVANVSVNRFLHSTKNAVMPSTIEPDLYLPAVAVASTGGMIIALSGAVIGGPLADALSPSVPIVAAAVCTALAALVGARLHLPRGEKRGLAGIGSELRSNLRDVRDGLKVLLGSPAAVYGVSSTWSMRGGEGFILLAALVLGRSRFDIGATGFSVVLGAVGVGGFVGALLAPAIAGRIGRPGVAPLAFLVAGVASFAGAGANSWTALLVVVGVTGVTMNSTKVAADAMIMSAIPDDYRGRAFAVYDIGYNGVFVLSALAATLLRPLLPDAGIVVVAGCFYVAVAAYLRWRRSRLPAEADVHG